MWSVVDHLADLKLLLGAQQLTEELTCRSTPPAVTWASTPCFRACGSEM
jgi:hypothetical protein